MMAPPFPGKWTFDHHPWLREMHDSTAEENIGMKAAQVGYSEMALNVVFFNMDINQLNCLYVLPNKQPDATDFSSSRFDPAIDLSEHLKKMFSDIKNIGHKKSGNTSLFIRGSNTRGPLKSIPVSIIVFDELEEMNWNNITLAEARSDGQLVKMNWKISTPVLPDIGIHKYYKLSTQEEYYFPCPCCSRLITLKFPDSLVITADSQLDPKLRDTHLICTQCKGVLRHEAKPEFLKKAQWVAQQPGAPSRGFNISQLFSCTQKPYILGKKALAAQDDPVDEQELYNSNLGLPHVVADAQVTDQDIDNCRQNYVNHVCAPENENHHITMGVDVGRVCHVSIVDWLRHPRGILGEDYNMNVVPKLLTHLTCDFPELEKLMSIFQVRYAVIDAAPEKRKSFEFANKFPGFVKCCTYHWTVKSRNLMTTKDEVGRIVDFGVTVNRSMWLDLALGRFKRKEIMVPKTLTKEYCDHVKALVKAPKRDKNGEDYYQYVNRGADHFAHSLTYAEIAVPFSFGASYSDIQ